MSAPDGPRTGIVVVSHSARLAEGVVEVAAQMAPDVALRAAGGTDDGGIGTSMGAVEEAVTALLAAGPVLITTDLGSATMTAETVLELLDDDDAARAALAEGPLVEGTVAAAVAAQGGGGLGAVARAVADAARTLAGVGSAAAGAGTGSGDAPAGDQGEADGFVETFVLVNAVGLHARPAALLARLVAGFEATVVVNGVDAESILELMALGLEQGDEMHVRASGPDAADALAAVGRAVAERFGEE